MRKATGESPHELKARITRDRLVSFKGQSLLSTLEIVLSSLGVLFQVAPLNGLLAGLPLVFLLPLLFGIGFVVASVASMVVVLLTSALQNSVSLNCALLACLCFSFFLCLGYLDLLRGIARLFNVWLKFHFKFLLGDEADRVRKT